MNFASRIKGSIPPKLKQFLKQIRQWSLSKEEKENNRLIDLPRYQEGSVQLLGSRFYFVDSPTFLYGRYEIIEKEIYRFVAETDSPTIIDCGANIGLSVIYFKTLYPRAKLIAFEPDSAIFNCLKRNVTSYDFRGIELHEAAVWTENGTMDFRKEGGFSGRIALPGDNDNIISVRTARLKDLLKSKIDFLKLDIEGAEYDVIKDCQEELRNVQFLFIEYHSHAKKEQTLGEILQILKGSGFRYFIQPAYVNEHPFTEYKLMDGMDLQLNIFALQNK